MLWKRGGGRPVNPRCSARQTPASARQCSIVRVQGAAGGMQLRARMGSRYPAANRGGCDVVLVFTCTQRLSTARSSLFRAPLRSVRSRRVGHTRLNPFLAAHPDLIACTSGLLIFETQTTAAAGSVFARSTWAIGLSLSCPESLRAGASQQRRERRMQGQHHPHLTHKPPRARQIAIVYSPEQFQPGVDPFHRRPPLVHPLEFLGRSRQGRKPPQIDFRGTRTVLPYDLPALQMLDIGHSQPSCLAGQRYFSVWRSAHDQCRPS